MPSLIVGNVAPSYRPGTLQPIAPTVAGALVGAAGGRTATIIGAACVAGSLLPLLSSRAIRGLGRPDSWNADPELGG